ncbi:hypothetical protein C6P42_004880 [Pichia californica]|nr:hypothetical protein C6P42_004880 [[Candida] californica]
MNPLEDLKDIFSLISTYQTGKNTLILDHDISIQLNYLTNNHFSKFSNDTNINKVIWFDDKNFNIDNDNDNDDNSINSIVFLLNLNSESNFEKLIKLSTIMKFIRSNNNNNINKNIHLITANPSFNKSVEKFISVNGILGDLTSFHNWNSLLYFQLSQNLFSLESSNDAEFKNLFLNNSTLPLELLAKSLLNLYISSNYKLRITNTYLKGIKSIQFWKIYNRLLNSYLQTLPDNKRKIIDDLDETIFMDVHSFYNSSTDLICLDRSVDIISLLLTQLSYSGLCNELFNTSNQLDYLIFNDNDNNEIKINLNDSNDNIYPQIEYLNFSHVGPILNKLAKNLQFEFDKRKNLKDINEMKNFVSELNNLKNSQSWVQKHTSLAECIINKFNEGSLNQYTNIPLLDNDNDNESIGNLSLQSYYSQLIELQQDIISNQMNLNTIFNKISNLLNLFDPSIDDIIKLIILVSITKNGIKESDFNSLNQELINKYGLFNISPILLNLQKLKLIQLNNNNNQPFWSSLSESVLTPSDNQLIMNFNILNKSLNLLPLHDEKNDSSKNSNDLADKYVDADFGYPGYVPIFTRLIQSIYDRSFLNETNPTSIPPQTSSSRAIKYGWNNLNLDQLYGPTKQDFLIPESKKKLFNSIIPPKISELNSNNHETSSTIIICVIGGLTWSELATIKYVLSANKFTKHKKLIVLTTGMITGSQMINSLKSPT